MHKIIGTAGHIDHGKSQLVRVLTGMDPDRLAEEQERGMTIDLGFAFLNENIAFIDVPGHEKFIKNMVAGVNTVDVAMLVIAADDGVMPQTREHLDILNLLQLKHGLVVLTKIDLVEQEWLDIVQEDVRDLLRGTFLEHAPLHAVSSTTGEGISELRAALVDVVESAAPRQDRGVFWMPIDRSFTIKGHGTVVTGSVLSGQIKVGDTCELLPQKHALKVRSIQTHGQPTQHASLGDRAALNLSSIAKDDIERGNVLATPDYFTPSKRLDARLTLLPNAPKSLTNRMRVRLHLGTREIMARLKILGEEKIDPGGAAYVQFMLEETAVAQKRDPFVVRRYSPQITIGGGIILDANPMPHKRTDSNVLDRLQKLETFDPREIITTYLLQQTAPIDINALEKQSGIDADQIKSLLADLSNQHQIVQVGKAILHSNNYEKLKSAMMQTLAAFHEKEPLRSGMKKANLLSQIDKKMAPAFDRALNDLIEKEHIAMVMNDLLKLSSHEIKLNEKDEKLANDIYDILHEAQFTTPPAKVIAQMLNRPVNDIERGINALLGLEKIVRFEGDIYFTRAALDKAKEKLFKFEKSEITVGEFRELLNTSRKFAMPLINYFDSIGVTDRVGDVRVIQRD